jgi:predicted signal transduction protein with EAL and GGDEF domain
VFSWPSTTSVRVIPRWATCVVSPIDLIKVDRSFVSGLGGGRGEDALVRAIVRLGHSLNIRTLAEGIESAHQVRELSALGCPLGQGYLFSRPADADTITALLANPATIEQTVASSAGGVGAPKRDELRLATEFSVFSSGKQEDAR